MSDPFESPIEEWDVFTVHLLLSHLGFPFYESTLEQNGVDGSALIHFDNEALKDIGILTVVGLSAASGYVMTRRTKQGQRLAILKAVYQYKLRDDVAIEADHWKPQEQEEPVNSQKLTDMLTERDTRIKSLELEVRKLSDQLSSFRDEVNVISKVVYTKESEPFSRLSARSRSPIGPNFPHPLSNAATAELGTGLHRSNSLQHPSTSHFYSSQARPHTADTLSPHDASPAHSPHDLPFGAETLADHVLKPGGAFGMDGNPPLTPSGLPNSMSSPNTPTHPSPVMQQPRSANKDSIISNASSVPTTYGFSNYRDSSGSTTSTELSRTPSLTNNNPSTTSNAVASTSRSAPTSGSGQSADQIQRSFKVTLTDPCFKVLPAALKKYKIPDDWRNYALFICYGGGSTERCLSYDEKPLLLFQKLKDNGQEPVFMLRHMKDIKSPIQVASQKHAIRREKRAKEKPKEGFDEDRTVTDGEEKDKDRDAGPHPHPMPSPGSATTKGFCISIYPYLADRDDEFDVNVGDVFVIVSKAKGWWIVFRQTSRNHDKPDFDHKTAWVPAGCLLETSVSPLDLAGDGNAATAPISSGHIVSVSTPGIALMDYKAAGSDELRLITGDQLRVYKRYNHWSYAVKEDTGERGWAPSWFIGKVLKKSEASSANLAQLSSRSLVKDGIEPASRAQEATLSPNSEVSSNPRTPNT